MQVEKEIKVQRKINTKNKGKKRREKKKKNNERKKTTVTHA